MHIHLHLGFEVYPAISISEAWKNESVSVILIDNRQVSPPHERTSWVLRLEPVLSNAPSGSRVLPLRHDPLQAHLAGMGEHGGTVSLNVFVEAQAGRGFGCPPVIG
jgi:hypothetical protein